MKLFKKLNKRQVRIMRYVLASLLIVYFFCLPRNLFDVPTSAVVLDRDGSLLGARIASDGQWRFPATNQIPDKLKQCMIAFEDDYFYYHWGVNPISISKAFYSNIKAGRVVRGGSTITMQVIRMSRNEARTIPEKMVEAILATRLEFRYSKDEILNLYASYAPFGGNVVGFAAASWRYFGRDAVSLSWAEAATLAVLPNSPSLIHISKRRNQLRAKRDGLLLKLLHKGVITEDTYELAIEEELPEEPIPLPQKAPHLVTKIVKEFPSEQSNSTINMAVQSRLEEIMNRWNREYASRNMNDLAAVIIDVETSEIIAYHGNSGFDTNRFGSQVDVADAPRSTGSILKPFLFAAMLDEGLLLPNELLPDVPLRIRGFAPQNFNLKYEGAVPASEALCRSLNLPSVYLLREYTPLKFYDKLKELHLSTLTNPADYYGLSLILGGAEGKLKEITASYMHLVQLARKQSTYFPKYLQKGKLQSWKPAFSAGAAWKTLDILTDLNRPEEVAWKQMSSVQKIAWKTGTSQGFRDAWAVGANRKYVIGVWVGNATGEGNPDLVGGRVAGPVLFELFNIFPNEPWIERPENEFVDAAVCRQSGYLKSRFCNDVDTILVTPKTLDREEVCPYHEVITVTPDRKNRVYMSCAGEEGAIQEPWFVLPPVMEWYYRKVHPEYEVLPPFKEGCGSSYLNAMQFIYPTRNADLIVTKQFDGSYGPIVFNLAHINPDAKVFWHLDGEYIGETTLIHQQNLIPEDGNHIISVIDNEGNTTSVAFKSVRSK